MPSGIAGCAWGKSAVATPANFLVWKPECTVDMHQYTSQISILELMQQMLQWMKFCYDMLNFIWQSDCTLNYCGSLNLNASNIWNLQQRESPALGSQAWSTQWNYLTMNTFQQRAVEVLDTSRRLSMLRWSIMMNRLCFQGELLYLKTWFDKSLRRIVGRCHYAVNQASKVPTTVFNNSSFCSFRTACASKESHAEAGCGHGMSSTSLCRDHGTYRDELEAQDRLTKTLAFHEQRDISDKGHSSSIIYYQQQQEQEQEQEQEQGQGQGQGQPQQQQQPQPQPQPTYQTSNKTQQQIKTTKQNATTNQSTNQPNNQTKHSADSTRTISAMMTATTNITSARRFSPHTVYWKSPHTVAQRSQKSPKKTGSHPTKANPAGTAAWTNFSFNRTIYLKTGVPMGLLYILDPVWWLHPPLTQTH